MLYLAFIFHMHQPYYKNLLTGESPVPWVRLHALKDYLDMVLLLEKYPTVHQTYNLVPSLLEQIDDYTNGTIKDKFLELSYKPAKDLSGEDKKFLLANFFSIFKDKVIACHPRYYQLHFMKEAGKEFTTQDFLDLQVWFNLAWTDPLFRKTVPEIKEMVLKGRFFTEEDKRRVLDKQIDIIKEVIPAYRRIIEKKQVEVTANPFYHPILPLLYNTKSAKEANKRCVLPKINFAYPEDAIAQIELAVSQYKEKFGIAPQGMWPSEESVCEHILPFIIRSGIKWIVADEAILYKSIRARKRDTRLLYQPHLLSREEGDLSIVFRDRNLSDMIGFVYHSWSAESAVNDFMGHLQNTALAFKKKDILVTIAMDGENAWEYYANDGHDFLELLYQRLSECAFAKSVTVSEYLEKFPATHKIRRLAAGSWIYGEFGKWIGNPHKVRAWEWLALAREDLERVKDVLPKEQLALAFKQMYICEGSDWFWWAGEDPDGSFDRLYRMHLANFYSIIGREIPDYLNRPLTP